MNEGLSAPPGIDVTQMSHARAYDYVLGGTDNFPVDRAAAEQVIRLAPDLPLLGQAQRRFLLHRVRECAAAGIDQFLDVGAGIPTSPNVHETAQATNPDARVVYADYDPIVTVHNTALLADHPRVVSIDADVRMPRVLMGHQRLCEQIDFDRPVLLLMIGLFHLLSDEEDPAALVAAFGERLAPGSEVVISQFCADGSDPRARAKLEEISVDSPSPMRFRRREEVERFFTGFEVVEPGVRDLHQGWPELAGPPTRLKVVAGVGRKR